MGLLDLLLVAVGLSMDAFAVSVCSMNYVFIIGIIQLVFCYCIDTVLLQIHICNCELRFFSI